MQRTRSRSSWPGRVAALFMVVGTLWLGACSDSQDPGVDQQIEVDDTSKPATSSNTLDPCPEGGPDATTPAAGCLGPDGTVQRP